MKPVPAITAPAALTAAEHAELQRLEKAVEKNQASYREIGRALGVIRDRRLYRPSRTFEDYCERRHDLDRSYVYRLIEAAEVAANVAQGRQIPANERQARALSQLAPEDQRKAWQTACETARGRITAALVERCAAELLGRPADASPGEVSAETMAAFEALPPEAQLVVLQRSEAAATAPARHGPARQVGGSNESERIQEIKTKVDRLKKIHAGLTDVADEADGKLDEYLAVIGRADPG